MDILSNDVIPLFYLLSIFLFFLAPKGSTLKRNEFAPLGANSFLEEWTTFEKMCPSEKQTRIHVVLFRNAWKRQWLVNIALFFNKASQAIQFPRTVPFFLLVSLLDGYSFPNVLVKGIVAFEH